MRGRSQIVEGIPEFAQPEVEIPKAATLASPRPTWDPVCVRTLAGHRVAEARRSRWAGIARRARQGYKATTLRHRRDNVAKDARWIEA